MSQNFKVNCLQIKSNESTLVDVKFSMNSSALAIIGQSGSGKSLTLKAILNLLPQDLYINKNIESNFEQNTDNISYVPQNPFTSLSPMTKIKDQFFVSKNKQHELLKLVSLESLVLEKFPSELSGGQLQRIIIAISIANKPKLILMDEPTTALDSITKQNIINLLSKLQLELKFKLIIVSHDINSLIDICQEVIILKNGNIVERGSLKNVLDHPQNEYTINLIESNFKNRKMRH